MSTSSTPALADFEARAAEFLTARRAWADGLDLRMEAGDDDQGADDGGQDDGEPDSGTDALGDAGKQALDRMKTQRNAARDELRAFKALGLSVEDIKALQSGKPAGDSKTGDAPDADEIQRRADAKATAAANARVLRSEVKAAAAGRLADPADAHKFLDLSQFEVDSDGNVDEDEIAEAIEDLISKKPYLAAAQGQQRRFQGGADQGARKEKPPSLAQQISKAESEGNWAAARALKARQLTALSSDF